MEELLHKVGFWSPRVLPDSESVLVFGEKGLGWASGFQTMSADPGCSGGTRVYVDV